MRGGLRDGHQHVRLHHRSHQPVPDQGDHGEIQQAAYQIGPRQQTAPSSSVQGETSGNIVMAEEESKTSVGLRRTPTLCQIPPDSPENVVLFKGDALFGFYFVVST